MYKFTNGIVVFDEKTKDAYIKSGMRLVEEETVKKTEAKEEIVEEETVNEEETDVFPNIKRGKETRSSTKKNNE